MSNDTPVDEIDRILELLSNPLSRYILSVIAGVDPGPFKDTIE